ncbi:HPr kinase/phosphatase C-terminal domain-containing protein [Sulfitobacter sp. LCG007]
MSPQDRHDTDRDGPLHASCVSLEGRGVLILGASGSGKSALALQLMALGARLVSDDRTLVEPRDGRLIASAPERIRGLIEARGVALLNAETAGPIALWLAIDLDRVETERLPPRRFCEINGISIPMLHNVEAGYFPAAILQYLKAGTSETS